ncbi:MAG: glycosyl hydrolase family 28 protein [Marinilabiliales bacterium]|nr:glycosyl hydrolase family 28 protein [Marinilabiliales bacterium]
MKSKWLHSTIVLLLMAGTLHAKEFSVRDFGAVSDTTVLSTAAIQNAIDACSREGGTVLFPAGNWLSGTLILKSRVTLRLEKGATLWGSRKLEDYLPNIPQYVALRTRGKTKQLIFAENASQIAILGEGTINGQGAFFADKTAKGVQYDRPHLIQMIHCSDIRIENVSLTNSGCWMEHYLACDRLQIKGIKVFNHCNKNNDGIDLDGCHQVTVSDAIIDSDDDALCIKSTSDRSSEDIVVSNCVLSSHCNAFKLGTETNGGFRNIVAGNLVVRPSLYTGKVIYGHETGSSAIALEMVDGGTLDGVAIANVKVEGTNTPIFIRLGNRARPFRDNQVITQVGRLSNVTLDNIQVTGARNLGCSITGIPDHPVENIRLSNIDICFDGGGTREDALRTVDEMEKEYPEAEMFGRLPAYGFFVRHARNVSFSHVRVHTQNGDLRPAFALSDARSTSLLALDLESTAGSDCNILSEKCEELMISGSKISGSSNTFLKLQGDANKKIALMANWLSNATKVADIGKSDKKEVSLSGNIH